MNPISINLSRLSPDDDEPYTIGLDTSLARIT